MIKNRGDQIRIKMKKNLGYQIIIKKINNNKILRENKLIKINILTINIKNKITLNNMRIKNHEVNRLHKTKIVINNKDETKIIKKKKKGLIIKNNLIIINQIIMISNHQIKVENKINTKIIKIKIIQIKALEITIIDKDKILIIRIIKAEIIIMMVKIINQTTKMIIIIIIKRQAGIKIIKKILTAIIKIEKVIMNNNHKINNHEVIPKVKINNEIITIKNQ